RSEFQIVAGGLGSHNYAAAAVLIVLVTLAFLGLSGSATSILFRSRRPAGRQPVPTDVPAAVAAYPVVAGIVALLILGLHPPAELTELISRAVAQLRGVS